MNTNVVKEVRHNDLKNAYTNLLEAAGEDVHREGLIKTPERAATALEYFLSGYRMSIKGKRRNYRSEIILIVFLVPEFNFRL